MRRLLFVFFLVFTVLGGIAQTADSSFCEIGINASAFVNQYLDLGNDDSETMSPYVLIAERKFRCIGLRGGLGIDTFSDNEFPDDDNGNTSLHLTETTASARLGLVWYCDISSRWSFRYGADVVYGINSAKSKTISVNTFGEEVTTLIRNDVSTYGGGPFAFIQFSIGKRVSIATELTGYFTLDTEVSAEENSQFPQFDDVDKNQAWRFSMPPPTALFLIWRFN